MMPILQILRDSKFNQYDKNKRRSPVFSSRFGPIADLSKLLTSSALSAITSSTVSPLMFESRVIAVKPANTPVPKIIISLVSSNSNGVVFSPCDLLIGERRNTNARSSGAVLCKII